MINKYKVTYTKTGSETEFSHCTLAQDPISALNQFHRFAQTKTPDRPAMKAGGYLIKSLHSVYRDARKEMVYSPYDLPQCCNPDLSKPEVITPASYPEPSFGWTDQELDGKLAQ